jgi:hypothetical protein
MRLNIFTVNVQMQEQQKNLKINAITVKLYFLTTSQHGGGTNVWCMGK